MEYNFEGSDPEQIEGTVESITYRNETNGYSVFKFNCDYGEITAVGQFSALSAGDMLRLEGFFETHKIYGQQFHAESYEQVRPATSEAILKYLSAGAIKGIGPSTAAKIVARFGKNTLDVMENEPRRLSQIKGISVGKLEKDLEFSNGSICKWNESEPGIRKVQKVADYLGVTIEELLK